MEEKIFNKYIFLLQEVMVSSGFRNAIVILRYNTRVGTARHTESKLIDLISFSPDRNVFVWYDHSPRFLKQACSKKKITHTLRSGQSISRIFEDVISAIRDIFIELFSSFSCEKEKSKLRIKFDFSKSADFSESADSSRDSFQNVHRKCF